jgi:hypothetical protein
LTNNFRSSCSKIRGFHKQNLKGKGVKFVGEVLEKQVNQLKNKIMSLTKPERDRN